MSKDVSFDLVSHISTDDPRLCYDLGVAFLVMGLAEKAHSYLVSAATDPLWLPIASAVLGGHFLEFGALDRAADWFRRGLAAPVLEHEVWVELSRGLNLAKRCATTPSHYLDAYHLRAA